MAAGAAHELNNPLAIVVTNAGFMAEQLQQHAADLRTDASPRSAEQRLGKISESLRDLEAAASRMARIVSDLRAFSRPAEQNSQTIELARCVEWPIRSTAHEFHHRARLRTEFGQTPPVNVDATRLEQVLVNLLVNAAQAIAPGSADRNEVSVVTRTDERGRAVIEVRDTGQGIAADAVKQIFEPFFTTKPVGMGTGLGLSICQGIVSSMGGEIQVESEPGKGTNFRVLLPPAPAEKIEAASPPSVPTATRPLRGRILAIDDEERLLRAIERILADEHHDVVVTESAREALSMIESGERFDIILCDLMMPTMTGIEFYETVLARNPDLARRVVFVTGGAITAKIDAFLKSVPSLRIDKPFKIADLRATIQRLLAAQTAERAPTDRPS